jgi:molybdopterin/thiamine biosynthesis adenylyltransferase
MASIAVTPWRLVLTEPMKATLFNHLFPGDNDEHGAIILAGVCQTDRGLKLVARELHLAIDGKDYVPGRRGYRMLKAGFIQSRIIRARDLKLAYLAVHNHGGTTSVGFSSDDFASHERGYPSLVDISRGMPAGALVFAQSAVAGDLWFEGGQRAPLKETIVLGQRRELLFPTPPRRIRVNKLEYDRQSRIFGDRGQDILQSLRIGIVGLGGAGSILAELLARLGVGEFVLADPDRADVTNLPRLIAARRIDAIIDWLPEAMSRKFARYKVEMASRNIRRANRSAKITMLNKNFLEADVAKQFIDCDYLFLAADTMGARLLFNAIVNQHGIPGVQVGAKVPVSSTGEVGDVFCVARGIRPGHGCLWCNGLINASRLQDEAISDETRRGLAYVADPQVVAPSVITLNAIACAHAADEFLFHVTGLKNDTAGAEWFRWNSRKGTAGYDSPRSDPTCLECSQRDESRLSRGDFFPLPTRLK